MLQIETLPPSARVQMDITLTKIMLVSSVTSIYVKNVNSRQRIARCVSVQEQRSHHVPAKLDSYLIQLVQYVYHVIIDANHAQIP